MDKFTLLHTIMGEMVNKLRLINATPIRKDGNESINRLKKNAYIVMIVEESLLELDKHGLVEEGSIGPTLDSLKKIKETLLNGSSE